MESWYTAGRKMPFLLVISTLLFLLVPSSSVSGAAGQAQTDISRLEAGFKEVEALLREGSEEPAASRGRRRLLKRCLSDFSIERVVGDREFHDKNMTRVIDDVRRYYSCEAFTRNDPDFFCKKLNTYWPLPPQRMLTDNCIDQYNLYTVVRLNVSRNPKARQICETLSLNALYLDGPWGGSTVQEECLFQTTPPGPGCRGITDARVRNALFPVGTENCLMQHVLFGEGDGGYCRYLKDSGIRNIPEQWCLDVVAYRKAYEANEIGLCGESLPCRMLMGKKVCRDHLEGLKQDYCRGWSGRQLGSEAAAKLARLGELLDAFEPKSDPGYASLRGVYEALRESLPADGALPAASAQGR